MCCGSNRAAARAAAMAAGSAPPIPAATAPAPTSVIMFEYVGTGAALIRGPVSGQLYRFAHPGDRLRVDPRDRPGLAASSSLRWIR